MAAFDFPDTTGQATDGSFQYDAGGFTYAWNGEVWNIVNGGTSGGGDGGGASVSVGVNPPSGPTEGDLWFNTNNGRLHIYYGPDPGASSQWVDVSILSGSTSGGDGGASIHMGENPPPNPSQGDLWWDSSEDSARLYVYYVDDDSAQWVEASPPGGGSGGGASVSVGENPPADPAEGDLWWDSSENSGRLYVWYDDGNTQQWVETSPSGSGGGDGDTIINNSGGADAWGNVAADGTLNGGMNCTSARTGTGLYTVTFNNAMPNDNYSVVATTAEGKDSNISVQSLTSNSFNLVTVTNKATPELEDQAFNFAVFTSDGNAGGYWTEESGALKPTNSANRVQVGGDRDTDAGGASFETYGLVRASRPSTQVNPNIASVFEGWLGTNATSHIFADGSANFDGEVIAGTGLGVGKVGCHLSGSTGTLQLNAGADNFNSILIGVNGNTEFGVKGNGDVYIGGNVIDNNPVNPRIFMDASAGTIRAANVSFFLDDGSTFAVKERVMNLISRLDAIEANEVIDDATDTSLLQLVASAAARLDSIEARLTALEGGN